MDKDAFDRGEITPDFAPQRRPCGCSTTSLQNTFDAGYFTMNLPRRRRPCSTSSTSARSQAMAGVRRPASDLSVSDSLAPSPKHTRRVSDPSDVEPSSSYSSSSSYQPPPQRRQPQQPGVPKRTRRVSDPSDVEPSTSSYQPPPQRRQPRQPGSPRPAQPGRACMRRSVSGTIASDMGAERDGDEGVESASAGCPSRTAAVTTR